MKKLYAVLLIAAVLIAAAVFFLLLPKRQDYSAQLASSIKQFSLAGWESNALVQARPRHDNYSFGNTQTYAALGDTADTALDFQVLYGGHKLSRLAGGNAPLAFKLIQPDGAALGAPKSLVTHRVRESQGLVTEAAWEKAKLTFVDFAPTQPQYNAVVRLVLAEGLGGATLRIEPPALEAKRNSARFITFTGSGATLGLMSDAKLTLDETAKPAALVKLPSSESFACCLAFVVGADGNQVAADASAFEAALTAPLTLLEATLTEQKAWTEQIKLTCQQQQTQDWLDGLLQLVRGHIGEDIIHTGSVKYAHNRAWARDNYWVQRALLEVGRQKEALIGLTGFVNQVAQHGPASSWNLSREMVQMLGYPRSEWPAYLVLAAGDFKRRGLQLPDGTKDYVQKCLEGLGANPEGLSVLNTDETWAIAAAVDEGQLQLDNSILNWLAFRTAEELELEPLFAPAAVEKSLIQAFLLPKEQRLAYAADGGFGEATSPNPLPMAGPLARAVAFGLPIDRVVLARTLAAAWEACFQDGELREDPRTQCVDDGVAGYMLYAAADLEAPFAEELFASILDTAPDTGNAWELHDVKDPTWHGEKRRLWDSALWLYGAWHYLVGVTAEGDRLVVNPHFSKRAGNLELQHFPVPKGELSLDITKERLLLSTDTGLGRIELEAPTGVKLVVTGKLVEVQLQASPLTAPTEAVLLRVDFNNHKIYHAKYDKTVKLKIAENLTLELLPEQPGTVKLTDTKQRKWQQEPLSLPALAVPQPVLVSTELMAAEREGRSGPLVSLLHEPSTWPDGWKLLAKKIGARGTLSIPVAITVATSGKAIVQGQKVALKPGRNFLTLQARASKNPAPPTPAEINLALDSPGTGLATLSVNCAGKTGQPVELAWIMPRDSRLIDTRGAVQWDRLSEPLTKRQLPNGQWLYKLKLQPGQKLPFGEGNTARQVSLVFGWYALGPGRGTSTGARATLEQALRL